MYYSFCLRVVQCLLLMLFISERTYGQWSSCKAINTKINATGVFYYDHNFDVTTDEVGETYITWTKEAYSYGNHCLLIQCQKLNDDGEAMWPENGVQLSVKSQQVSQNYPEIYSDPKRNVIVIWAEYYDFAYNIIYAQKIDGSGKLLWGESGLRILHSREDDVFKKSFRTVKTIDEKLLVFSTKTVNPEYIESDIIIAQKIDFNGNKLFQGEVEISSRIEESCFNVCSDHDSGAFLTWQQFYYPEPTTYWGYDVCVQKFSSSGEEIWPYKTVRISRTDDSKNIAPEICPDGLGGVYVLWRDKGLQLQHLDKSGNKLWTQKKVSDNIIVSPIKADSSHCVFIQYSDTLAKIDYDGNLLWAVIVSTDNAYEPLFNFEIGNGNEIYVSWHERFSNNYCCQCISPSGEFLWNNPVIYTTQGGDGYLIPGKSGDIIGCWNQKDFYAQKILSNGSLAGSMEFIGDLIPIDSVAVYKYPVQLAYSPYLEQGELTWEFSQDSLEFHSFYSSDYYDTLIGTLPLDNHSYFRVIQSIVDCHDTSATVKVLIKPLLSGDFYDSDEHFIVLPNPFHNEFIISSTFYTPTDLEIHVYTANGLLICNEKLSGVNGHLLKSIRLPEVKKGIYFVKLTARGKSFVKKIVKN